MDLSLFLRGLLIGLAIAAPVGPIGLLCIRRSLSGGFAPGFFTGLGAAVADGVYGAVAAFGLTAVASFLAAGQGWLRLVGGAALIVLGVSIALKTPPAPRDAAQRGETLAGLAAAFGQTFLLTLANPATVLSFLAIFAGLGLGGAASSAAGACAVVAGVFLGSAAWWLFLAGVSARLGHAIAPAAIKWINRASGAGVAGFGLAAVASFFLA
jgi:threonine/homoserine/homoserine lactone efflux protein